MAQSTIIVTGASTGIGKAIAALFIKNGHNVIMNSQHAGNLEATYKELGEPSNARLLAGDIAQPETGEALVALALKEFGSVDVLINNAGVFAPKPFLDVTRQDLDRFYEINLRGTFFTTQSVIRAMVPQGHGSIINIGTVLVSHAIDGFPATAPISSKGGVHALTVQLAAEFGRQNIRVNAIAPGIIRSPLQQKTGVDNADSLAGLHLLNRIGETEDIASMAYALAFNNFITGAIINVDGGHVAGHKF